MDTRPIPTRKLPKDFDVEAHTERLRTQGFTIIENYMSADQLARFRDGLKGHLGTYRGRNPFEGLTTERVYTLVGRGKVYEEIAEDARLLALLDRWLLPHYLLSANHAICIYPGEKQQGLHYDDSFYPFARPRPAISMSTIGAIDAFTAENGGTVMYPGSHLWPAERMQALFADRAAGRATQDTSSVHHLTMPAGALCLFQGTLVHGAGANCSAAPRLAYTNHYCEPWARQQENFALGVPKDRVARMSRELQALLGYDLRQPGDIMGQVGGYHPAKTLDPGWVLPVLRPPRGGEH
jgi:ectoine hydroxylase-related dioxygenase (phytanoyl-CoA dioxygenase family)